MTRGKYAAKAANRLARLDDELFEELRQRVRHLETELASARLQLEIEKRDRDALVLEHAEKLAQESFADIRQQLEAIRLDRSFQWADHNELPFDLKLRDRDQIEKLLKNAHTLGPKGSDADNKRTMTHEEYRIWGGAYDEMRATGWEPLSVILRDEFGDDYKKDNKPDPHQKLVPLTILATEIGLVPRED